MKVSKPVEGEKAMFVRSHPTQTPDEVVALASAAGLMTTAQYVREVRRRDRDRAALTSAVAEADGPSSEPAPPRKPTSGSDFIRQVSFDVRPAEVVEQGRAAGFVFGASLVHQVRSTERSKKKKSPLTASEFVRTLPVDMPALEVVARGKAAGLRFTPSLVAYARRPRDKASAPYPDKPMTKADFVRSLPLAMPFDEVKLRAVTAGFRSITQHHVTDVRRTMMAKPKHESNGVSPPRTSGSSGALVHASKPVEVVASPVDHRTEALLRASAARLGLERAISILQRDLETAHAIEALLTHD